MTNFPKTADIVIVGIGGIVGASVAHHLIKKGLTKIVGIDKSSIPTDIGSTSHASDFCYLTAHDKLTCYTTKYSVDFYNSIGHYSRIGGLEVARHDDDERMEELKRKVSSGRAFGSNVEMISPQEAKKKMPLLEEKMIQGAMWDPDAGLVTPRSQTVAGKLIEEAEATGMLSTFQNTSAEDFHTNKGQVTGVVTNRGIIETNTVIICAGLWGRLIANMVGEDLPIMPVDHPLCFFGPYKEFEGTGLEIGYPLLRDQGNSAYLRDTGDPSTAEGGQIEWGYYEESNPRLVHPKDLLEKGESQWSPSQRSLDIEQIVSPLERAIELTPILGEIGWNEKRSFNGLLQVTTDGQPSVGQSTKTKGLWYAEAIWVKDAPGIAKLLVDMMTDGTTDVDISSIDIARHYAFSKSPAYIYDRCYESALKIYNPSIHNREPYTKRRNLRVSPFWEREKELGGHFLEIAGWERAHGYAYNDNLIEKYSNLIPTRDNEWDNRHFWIVSNAEQLAMSDHVGMINLSHFAIYDIYGADAEILLEYASVAKVGGDTPIGKGIYTQFLDNNGGVRSDLTVLRLDSNRFRVIDGIDAGNRDYIWLKQLALFNNWKIDIEDFTDQFACIGLWGPEALSTLSKIADEPETLSLDCFPLTTFKEVRIQGIPVLAFRISYVGESGWELHFPFSYGLRLWDLLFEEGVIPVGIETYANSRRLEKSFRLQNADLLTEYNLIEAGLSRRSVKEANFHGKNAYVKQRNLDEQVAHLCTISMTENTDGLGISRYPIGNCPIVDPKTNEVLIDSLGRRSFTTSISYGPSIGKNIALCYLPKSFASQGNELLLEYFDEQYPIKVEAVGYRSLYDPKNLLPKSEK